MGALKRYVADTVALLAYMVDNLPKKADRVFEEVENNRAELIIPSICVGEFIYTMLKQRNIFSRAPPIDAIDLLLDIIEQSENIKYSTLTLESWRTIPTIDVPGLHDRIIVATYLQERAEAIITNDNEIRKVAKTIWD